MYLFVMRCCADHRTMVAMRPCPLFTSILPLSSRLQYFSVFALSIQSLLFPLSESLKFLDVSNKMQLNLSTRSVSELRVCLQPILIPMSFRRLHQFHYTYGGRLSFEKSPSTKTLRLDQIYGVAYPIATCEDLL